MSRFFDALKEASRSNPPTDGDSGLKRYDTTVLTTGPDTAATAQPMNRAFLPEIFPSPIVENDNPATLGAARQLLDSLQPQPNAAPVEPSSSWQQMGIVLDTKARVIPRAVDATVLEHYRRLRTKIVHQQATKAFRLLLVTSPNPQEGKTLTVLNLGYVFAMLPSFRVLLVDGDLRRGSLAKLLGMEGRPGLSDIIEGTTKIEQAIIQDNDLPLHFIPKGTSQKPAAELLQSPRLGRCFRELAERFDLVIVDSPPTNLVTDVQQLAENSEAVLVVARAFATKRKALEQAAQELKRYRIIGTVLNGGTRAQLYRRRYDGYY